jgi:hypothetical protein
MIVHEIERSSRPLADRFRLPSDLVDFSIAGDLYPEAGYFQFGPDVICYGQCSSGIPSKDAAGSLHDALRHADASGDSVQLPFDPSQILENLRYERYLASSPQSTVGLAGKKVARSMYYAVRPLMPVAVRRHFQRLYLRGWENVAFPHWPVDRTVEQVLERLLLLSMKSRKIKQVPFIWFWPEAARSCTIVTHDVETSAGRDFCGQLMDLDDSFGVKAAFQVVPEGRYAVPGALLPAIQKRGFEFNVHDLNHDGHLTRDREQFLRRAEQINRHARQSGAQGFRSAVLNRNIDWYDALDFSYDMSVPNVAHLDPQRGGCCTVMPFFIGKMVELPVTLTQDYSLFHILNDYSIRLWKEQISLIREKHGLISVIVHPDYIIDEKARRVYVELLQYLADLREQGETWIALPRDVADWWRLRSELNLVSRDGRLQIEGKGSERARIAYATIVDEKLVYTFNPVP